MSDYVSHEQSTVKTLPLGAAKRRDGSRLAATIGLALLCALLLITAGALAQDDGGDSELQNDESGVPDESPEVVAGRVIENMESASDKLKQATLAEEVRERQREIIADLDRLIEQAERAQQKKNQQNKNQQQASAKPQAGQPQPDSAKPQAGDESQAGQDQAGPPRRNDQTPATSADQEPTAGQASVAAELERRRGLANSVWGHLPPKVRERLRSSFNERYLPEYEDLVRKYYEALAEDRDD